MIYAFAHALPSKKSAQGSEQRAVRGRCDPWCQ